MTLLISCTRGIMRSAVPYLSSSVRLYNALRKKTARNPPGRFFAKIGSRGSRRGGAGGRENTSGWYESKRREGVEKEEARARREREIHVKTNDIGSLETRWRRGQPRPGGTSCIGTRTRNESSRQSGRFLVGPTATCLERQLTGSAMPSGPAPPRYDALCLHRVPPALSPDHP